MKILIIDDEPPIMEAVAYSLRKQGYRPIAASDAAHGMDLFAREAPDLIILDVMLPNASGFELCKEIRRNSDVPIIMLSARADEVDRVLGLELGADDY